MNWAVSIGVTWLALAAGAALTQEVPIRSTPQNEPCPDQPTTVEEARDAFSASRQPGLSEIAGTWVAIGMLSDSSSLNCSGVTRGPVFEWVMAMEEDALEIDMIGMHVQI